MRFFILILVALAHILLLLWLTHDARVRQPEPEQPTAQETTETAEKPTPQTPGGPRLGPDTFQNRQVSEPPLEVARKTGLCNTGILVDWTDKTLLWKKHPDRVVAIASLTKMMTALLLMEAVQTNAHTLEEPVRVTPAAYNVGGSQVYLDPRETFTLEELLKCTMIFSANDAAYLVAEYLGGGKVEPFVARMNKRADALGLEHTHFHNPHGLPESGSDRENRSTAREMAFLAGHLLRYPAVVKWSSTWLSWIREDTDKPFQLANRNRLVQTCPGVIGMKTGYTNEAGYCIAAVADRNDRVMIAVVTGCPSSKKRNDLVETLLDWGYERQAPPTTANPP